MTILQAMDAKNVSLLNLSPSQLRRAADLKVRIEELVSELERVLDIDPRTTGRVSNPKNSKGATHKRTMSAEGRRRIAEAARARWARVRGEKGQALTTTATETAGHKGRTMSPAARRKIATAARARWAKVKAAKQNT